METESIRLLGAAVLFVFFASLMSEQMLSRAVGRGGTADMLARLPGHMLVFRLNNMVALANSLGIIILAALFYRILGMENETLAQIALGFWLAEAIILAASKVGTLGLISLSQEFVAAGDQASAQSLGLAEFIHNDVDRRGYDLHMLIFCFGGMIGYCLLHQADLVPPLISLWGLVSISLLAVLNLVQLFNRNLTQILILGLPYAPYELGLGSRLLITGSG